MWIGGDCYDAYGDRLRNFVETIPDDFIQVGFRAPGGWESSPDYPEYRWAIRDKPDEDETAKGIDSRRFLSKWDYFDEYIEKMPDPVIPDFFTGAAQVRKDNPDAFVVGMDFFCFYERLWTIRGMQDLLADFLLEPEKTMRLTNAVRDFHLKVIRGYGSAKVDAIYTSDDAHKEQKDEDMKEKNVDTLFEQIIRNDSPGAAVSVIKDGSIIYKKGGK
jgi:uroporphyrinogen decarboxylase